MSLELDSSFEADLRESILDVGESEVAGAIAPSFERAVEDNFRAYAARQDYDISHIWEDVEMDVTRVSDTITATIEWPELTALFEFGVSPHTIEGDPLLHFYWGAIDQWVVAESVEWGSRTGGIPESRAIRDALNDLRRGLEA